MMKLIPEAIAQFDKYKDLKFRKYGRACTVTISPPKFFASEASLWPGEGELEVV